MNAPSTLSTPLRKMVQDINCNRVRSLLVVLSIAVGIFSVGMALGARSILGRELPNSYAATAPHSITFSTTSFDDDLLASVRRMPEVVAVEGRREFMVRMQSGPDEWKALFLFAIDDFTDQHVDRLEHVSGAWPPAEDEILFDQASMPLALEAVAAGQSVRLKLANGDERRLRAAGIGHDQSQQPASFEGSIYGYISMDALERLDEPRFFNTLHVRVDPAIGEQDAVRRIARRVRDKIEDGGVVVYSSTVPEPGKAPLQDTVDGILILLGALSVFVIVLSGFLVFNTFSALLSQHVRQIGIMKSIGASTTQIAALYLGTALIFSLAALLLAMPLSVVAARLLSAFVAQVINCDLVDLSISPVVPLVQVVVGVFIPLLSAWYPIRAGANITILEALNNNLLSQVQFKSRLFNHMLFPQRGLPAPWLLPLRNIFRHRVRLVLTLTSLTFASAFFIAVMSTYQSAMASIEDVFQYWRYDFQFNFSQPHPISRVEQSARSVSGVAEVKSWGYTTTNRVHADGSDGDMILMYALPADTFSVEPKLLSGRWLLPEDDNAIVITNKFLDAEPNVAVGDTVRMKVNGNEVDWYVVGVAHMLMGDGPTVYVNLPYYTRLSGNRGKADGVHVLTRDPETLLPTMQRLEHIYKNGGIHVTTSLVITELRAMIEAIFSAVTAILTIMAVLLSLVGGLGLASIMSLNVLERSREIGVLRAIGAGNAALLAIVLREGMFLGLLSWALGCLLALPLCRVLNLVVGMAIMQTPFTYSYSLAGALGWLLILLILTALACILPARNAMRITIRDALAYE